MGIQAFEPVLIEGKAIQLHPLVCTAFNADFDGDQMAVHVPLSLEAQLEARVLMMSTNNILSPANGKPIIVPTQDMILGLYYATMDAAGEKGEGMMFGDVAEIEHALNAKAVSLHARIKARYKTVDASNKPVTLVVETTSGRMLLAEELPRHPNVLFTLVNRLLRKKEITEVIDIVYRHCGQKETVIFCDHIMVLGFHHSAKAGISFGKDDLIIPKAKEGMVKRTGRLREGIRAAVPGRSHHQGREVQQGRGHLVALHRRSRRSDDEGNREGPKAAEGSVNSVYMMAHSVRVVRRPR